MSIKIYVSLFCVILLSGCVSDRMVLSQVCDGCAKTDSKNPYSKKLLGVKKNVTTTDQIFAMFGDPESVTEQINNLPGGRVQHYQAWEYKSDEYESAAVPYPETYGTWVNGLLKVEFLEGRVVNVVSSEKPSREPRPYWLQTHPNMSAQELARIKELEKKWQDDMQATQANYQKGIQEGRTRIPPSLAQKALLGEATGSACQGSVDAKLSVKTAHRLRKITNGRAEEWQVVAGSFKSGGSPLSPGAPAVETAVEGYFDLQSGFLHLPATTVKLVMELRRDAIGAGWVGVVVGNGMGDCRDIVLTSVNGVAVNALPPSTGLLAFRRAQQLAEGHVPADTKDDTVELISEHWLSIAEQEGYDDASYALARYYEQKGARAPEYYRRAIHYYQSAAERFQDVRAQQALGQMYADGRGTVVNPTEAQRWRAKASATLKRASELCTSPSAVTAIRNIIRKDLAWAATFEKGVGALLGVRVDSGSVTGVVSGADDVISLSRPFVCVVETRRVDARYDASEVPDIVYVERDEHGREQYSTSAFGPAVRLTAAFANAIAKSAVRVERLSMELVEGKKYKISTMYDQARTNYSETVEH